MKLNRPHSDCAVIVNMFGQTYLNEPRTSSCSTNKAQLWATFSDTQRFTNTRDKAHRRLGGAELLTRCYEDSNPDAALSNGRRTRTQDTQDYNSNCSKELNWVSAKFNEIKDVVVQHAKQASESKSPFLEAGPQKHGSQRDSTHPAVSLSCNSRTSVC